MLAFELGFFYSDWLQLPKLSNKSYGFVKKYVLTENGWESPQHLLYVA
jgi:hypothetical protein